MAEHSNKMHEHQRHVYYDLKRFLENPPEGCRIAVLTGIRRIGKTSVLTDLRASLPDTEYIDFSKNRNTDEERKTCLEFAQAGTGILLIDEITQLPNYEALVEGIERTVYNGAQNLRVVFTGSSSLHLLALKSGLLGAGRAKLFRMSFLSFAEYLVFTGKKEDYCFAGSTDLSAEDFKNYLQLKNLPAAGLRISFDREYMVDLYKDIELSNQSSRNPGAFASITVDDILSVLDLVAYTLQNVTSWAVFRNPDGVRELTPVGVTDVDMTGLRVYVSSRQLKSAMSPQNMARALYYLIVANLAYVEVEHSDPQKVSASDLARYLFDIRTGMELEAVFAKYNICLVSPLWYMFLAKEILEQHGVSASKLLDTPVIGEVLENYVKGSYCRWQSHQYEYEVSKIGSARHARTNEERVKAKEVDLCDVHRKLLCEITVSNKKWSAVHLLDHFSDAEFIRVLATRDHTDPHMGIHRIPYPKLCAMVDTGEVFGLSRSTGNV